MLPKILQPGITYTPNEWEWVRRPQILELFEQHVYGETPKECLDHWNVSVTETEEIITDTGTVLKETIYLELEKDGKRCGFHTRIYQSNTSKETGRFPAVIMINPFSKNISVDYPGREHDQLPYEIITSAGYIAVHADVDELCLDDPKQYKKGLWELYPREGDSVWGSIGMWAFAISRLLDYLQTRDDINPAKIAVCGCSRAGKTALWCTAQDPRIALVISNVSGCTGAAITRGKSGERVKDITSQFPHWMCKRYASYADLEETLPVDQHMLLALCAPRPVYVSSASEDTWADPRKEFEAVDLVESVYRIYGKKGINHVAFPPVNTPVFGEQMGYHNREGVHGCRPYDWLQFINFMNCFLK